MTGLKYIRLRAKVIEALPGGDRRFPLCYRTHEPALTQSPDVDAEAILLSSDERKVTVLDPRINVTLDLLRHLRHLILVRPTSTYLTSIYFGYFYDGSRGD
jgi:hypothetical protein